MRSAFLKKEKISAKGVSIYGSLDRDLFYTIDELEFLIRIRLDKFSVKGLANRTRSKIIKKEIANSLGYPAPDSFKKTQPRFLNQDLDVYNQKSNNLQIWNESIVLNRRYLIIKIDKEDIITDLRIIEGKHLSILDTTGTLTRKYQAKIKTLPTKSICHKSDTKKISKLLSPHKVGLKGTPPCDISIKDKLLPIKEIFNRIKKLEETNIRVYEPGQERCSGEEVHKKICELLGHEEFKDDGKFPDIKNQLLEIKMQTSPTIDIGLFLPNSEVAIELSNFSQRITPKDIRYSIIYVEKKRNIATIKTIIIVNGENFFDLFNLFKGRVVNKKIQIPIPNDFYG